MDDYISRKNIEKKAFRYEIGGYKTAKVVLLKDVMEAPSINVIAADWTLCSEGFPKDEANSYLVYLKSGCVCECRWTNVNMFWTDHTTEWHWNIFDIPQYDEVLAWMLLPKPPVYCDGEKNVCNT